MVASQQPAPIPDDERALREVISEYEGTNWTEASIRDAFNCAGHAVIRDSQTIGVAHRLALRALRAEAALTALRDFMWSEGYADQTAVMRQADAALGTPGREKP